MKRLSGKCVVVTGGTSGLGEDAVLRFLQEGAQVVFTGRDKDKAAKVIKKALKISSKIHFFKQNVTDEADWQALVQALPSLMPRVDILVNNAGAFIVGPIEGLSEEDFSWLYELNVGSIFLGIKYLMPIMKQQGGGVILNNASLSGMVGHEHCIAYCTSKAAAIQLGLVAALEGAPYKVRVVSVAPGPVWNDMLATKFGDTDERRDFFVDTQPYKTLCVPKHVTDAMVFLVSDEARYITGTTVKVDCGRGAD
jgi:NAD(P)-dependent dehydrogenase (short-subunit alcohol dehydrogenase family)